MVTDIEGNAYRTVTIGNQEWFAENLRTTKYNDGISIPNITSDSEWKNLNSGAYCWYNNSRANYADYFGGLYNWYAVNTGKLCPTGWRVPTDADWSILTDYIGGESVAGTKLKAPSGWNRGGNGTDDYGFSALPGGYRSTNGGFSYVGNTGYWWSSTEYDTDTVWRRYVYYNSSSVSWSSLNKSWGFSVRCVRDFVRTDDE